MKAEFWTVLGLSVFFVIVTPVYWLLAEEITGAVALTMTMFFCLMMTFFFGFVSRAIPPRPEDRKDGEIADGAGELGFFPPFSWWPLWCALTFGGFILGFVFGWWLMLMMIPFGVVVVVGWVFEYYRGIHAH